MTISVTMEGYSRKDVLGSRGGYGLPNFNPDSDKELTVDSGLLDLERLLQWTMVGGQTCPITTPSDPEVDMTTSKTIREQLPWLSPSTNS